MRVGLMPCGHPAACVCSSKEGTHWCAWCASEAESEKKIERLRKALEFYSVFENIVAFLDEWGTPIGEYYFCRLNDSVSDKAKEALAALEESDETEDTNDVASRERCVEEIATPRGAGR